MPQNPQNSAAGPVGPFKGLLEDGNVDLKQRPQVKTPEGKTATVRSASFNIDGKETLLPTVSDDGRLLSEQEAVDIYKSTGKHLGKFDSPESANTYAEELHRAQQDYYANDAAQFDTDFAESYDGARRASAVDFGEQFAEPAGGSPTLPKAPEEGGVVDAADKTLGGMRDNAANPVDKAGFGVTRDVTLGMLQAPRHVVRGVVNGVNGMVKFIDGAMDYLPTIGILDEEGDLSYPRVNTRGTAKERLDLQAEKTGNPKPDLTPQVPNLDPAKVPTVTGNVIEAISQFATGFKAAGALAKAGAMGETVGQFLQNPGALPAIVKGALGDLFAFDQHQERLSNVVQQVPALQNPVTEYLAAQPDDSLAEGKFKQAVEGIALGGAGEVLFRGVALMKKGMQAKAAAQEAGAKLGDIGQPAGAGPDFSFLGDAADDAMLIRRTKIEQAEAEVQGEFGKPKQIPAKPSKSIDDYEINFARIEGPDDIKRLMNEMVNRPELKVSIEAERRGTRSNAETLKSAQDIDGFESLMQRRTGDAFNAEQIVAGRKVYYDTTDKLLEAAKRAAAPNAGDIDQFNFRKMVATHHAVQKEFMGIRAEAGRALQAWSIPLGGSGQQNAQAVSGLLNEFGGGEASKDLAARLVELGGQLNTAQINAITQKAAGARTLDAVAEAWTLGLLTNPQTHVVNLTSNVLTSLQLGTERLIMAGMQDTPVTWREGGEFFLSLVQEQRLAFKNMAQAFRTGETGFGTGKIDLPRERRTARDILDPEGKAGILSKALDGYGAILSKYAGGALAAADEYSKTLLFRAQLRSLAVRRGAAQGLEGDALAKFVGDIVENPPPGLRGDANDFAQYGTFTRELGQGGQKIQQLIAKWPMLRFVAPFVRTPGNIFKFAFERTPLAPLSSAVRADIAAGGVRRASALSRIGMGSSVMALGADMALQGKLTGAGPRDPEVRAALKRTGWQPYSIKVGETWYSYARLDPVATLLGMSADIGEILSNYETYDIQSQTDVDQLVTAAAIAAGNQLVGKTFMRGFADITEALSDPVRYGEGWLQRYAGSIVPAGSAALERAASPEQEYVFSALDAMRARIPGVSNAVPKKRNVWGEEIKYFYPNEKDVAGATAERVLSIFNPVYYSAEKDAPLDRWMLKNGFSLDMPDKVQEFTGVRLDLREHPEIYSRLVELRGNGVKLLQYGNQTMKEFFTSLAGENDAFGRHVGFFMALGNTYEDQQNFISHVARDYQTAAKQQLLEEFENVLAGEIAAGRRNAANLNEARKSIKSGGEQ